MKKRFEFVPKVHQAFPSFDRVFLINLDQKVDIAVFFIDRPFYRGTEHKELFYLVLFTYSSEFIKSSLYFLVQIHGFNITNFVG